MATAPITRATERDYAWSPGPRVVSAEVPLAEDTSTPTAVETDTAQGPTPFSGFETTVVAGGEFGESPFGEAPFGGTVYSVVALGTLAIGAITAAEETDTASTLQVLSVRPVATAVERDLALPLTSLVDDGEYATAIDAADRVPVYVIKADWNRNGLYDHPLSDLTELVEQVEVTRDLTGALPAEVGIVEGYSTAEVRVRLAGTWVGAAAAPPPFTVTAPPAVAEPRINLAINPSVEVDTVGYTVITSGTLGALGAFRGNAEAPFVGSYYLYSRPVDNGSTGALYIRCPLIPVTPGVTYTFSAYRQIVGTLATSAVGIDWMDNKGNQLPDVSIGANITGGGWSRGHVTATAPVDASFARQFLVCNTASWANYARWDAIMAEADSVLGDYFDGDSPDAQWNGAAQASSSSKLAQAVVDPEVEVVDVVREAREVELDPVDVFAPYRTDSPLFGRPILRTPIYLETGFITDDGPRLTRKFTGTVSSVNPSSADRVVELHALDTTSQLRQTITLPAVGLFEDLMSIHGPDSYRSRINSHWFIDHALRRNGIYAGPPPREDAVLSVTGAGSMIPEIGWGGAPEDYYTFYRGEMWTEGAFGSLTSRGGDLGTWWPTEAFTAAGGDGFGLSIWMFAGLNPADQRELVRFNLTSDNAWTFTFGIDVIGHPYFGAISPSGTETRVVAAEYLPPTIWEWRYIGVHVTFGATTMTVRFRINGRTYTYTATIAARATNWRPDVSVRYLMSYLFNYFQVWHSPIPPTVWQGESWIPQADIDPGANEFTGVPELKEVEAWSLIKEITEAEGSTFWFTEEGRAQFRTAVGNEWYNRRSLVGERITADRNLSDLASNTDESTIRNVITLTTSPQYITGWEDIFEATMPDQFDTPPGTTVFEINLEGGSVYELPATNTGFGIKSSLLYNEDYRAEAAFVFAINNDEWQEINGEGLPFIRVCIVFADDPFEITNPAEFPVVMMRVDRVSSWKMRLHVVNNSARIIRFATPHSFDQDLNIVRGGPALRIAGRRLRSLGEDVEIYTDNASVDLYGPSVYEIGGSNVDWKQVPNGLRGLATNVLASTSHPVPVLDAVDVPHDPRRKLGQRVVLADPGGLGEVTGSIVSLHSTYSRDAATTDQVTVRPLAPPGLGVLDDPTLGLLDSTLVLGP